jgi:hypothetical protein
MEGVSGRYERGKASFVAVVENKHRCAQSCDAESRKVNIEMANYANEIMSP